MNIFITGDTHGDLSKVIDIYNTITSDNTPAGIPHVDKFDYLIHCGDYKNDGSSEKSLDCQSSQYTETVTTCGIQTSI